MTRIDIENSPLVIDGIPTDFYAALLAARDWSKYPVKVLEHLITTLIVNGSVFLGFWGAQSERVHDLADSILMLDAPNASRVPIPTSWEDCGSFDEELWHFLFSYTVDPEYVPDCSWIVFGVGDFYEYSILDSIRRIRVDTNGP